MTLLTPSCNVRSVVRVNHGNFHYYICLGSQFFYLLREDDFTSPMQFRYDQLRSIRCDTDCRSLFALTLSNESRELATNITLESSDRDQVVSELQIRYRTALIAKTWSALPSQRTSHSRSSEELDGNGDTPAVSTYASRSSNSSERRSNASELPLQLTVTLDDHIPPVAEGTYEKPTFELVRQRYHEKWPDVMLHSLHDHHFLPLHEGFSTPSCENRNTTHAGFDEIAFNHTTVANCHLSVKIVEKRDMFTAAKVNVSTLAEKLATSNLLTNQVDYDVVRNGGFKKVNFLFEDDKTVWNGHEFIVDTVDNTVAQGGDRKTIAVIVLRRMYIPPDANSYQDFSLELHIPHSTSSPQQRQQLIEQLRWSSQNLQPMPQCFIYDTLFLRARLESLEHDEWFYAWCQRMFHFLKVWRHMIWPSRVNSC